MAQYESALKKHLDDDGKVSVAAQPGFRILQHKELLQQGDCPFDVYSGWLGTGFYNPDYDYWAVPEGRFIAWQRAITPRDNHGN